MTPATLYRLKNLSHTLLLHGEWKPPKNHDDDEYQMAIRQLISEGRLKKTISVKVKKKTAEGGWVETFDIENVETEAVGMAAAWSTTADKEDFIDETMRRINFNKSDDTSATTERVLDMQTAQAALQEGLTVDQEARLTKQAHAYFRSLNVLERGKFEINVWYAKFIRPVSGDCIMRSIYPMLLLEIKIAALLRQHRRQKVETDGNVTVFVDFDDYVKAYALKMRNAPRIHETVNKDDLELLRENKSAL